MIGRSEVEDAVDQHASICEFVGHAYFRSPASQRGPVFCKKRLVGRLFCLMTLSWPKNNVFMMIAIRRLVELLVGVENVEVTLEAA